jgi:hypothetical protein
MLNKLDNNKTKTIRMSIKDYNDRESRSKFGTMQGSSLEMLAKHPTMGIDQDSS